LPAEVQAEPRRALEGDIGGYERLARAAAAWLGHGGALVAEIGETMGSSVVATFGAAGFVDIEVRRDLTGRDRVVIARWP
jgi:release factor glutamine methyltransferase